MVKKCMEESSLDSLLNFSFNVTQKKVNRFFFSALSKDSAHPVYFHFKSTV